MALWSPIREPCPPNMNLTSITPHRHEVNRNRSRATRLLATVAAGLLLGGCITRQLEPDFAAVSQSYADNMNWQMLLNLARLDQGHPAYFMAIGEVRISRTQAAGLQAQGNTSHQVVGPNNVLVKTVTNVLGGTLTPNATANANPTFVFIPINSDDAAKQLLSPIPIDVFNTLYQQGWPVDQLLRVLVERIEVEQTGGTHLVLSNSPTRAEKPDSFTRFLRACEVVRELQKRGGLQLLVEEVEEAGPIPATDAESLDKTGPARSGVAVAAADSPPKNAKGGAADSPSKSPPGSGASGAVAGGKNAKAENAASTKRSIYRFSANQKTLETVLADFPKDSEATLSEATLDNFRGVFQSTLTVGSGATVASVRDDSEKRVPRSTLVLRSFRNVLDAVAQEQGAFDVLMKRDSFKEQIPKRQRQPVLRTDWSDEAKTKELLRPVISLSYAGHTYQITDPKNGDITTLDARWNRDVFRLLIDLSSQVTVDITKFQRQTLELTQ